MTHDEIKQNILTLGEDYKAGKMNYTDYKSQYDKLAKKWAKLCKPKSFGEILKEDGIKVTKNGIGWYTYHGKNFTVDIFNEECETKWWEVSIYADNLDQRVFDHFNEWNNFDTKKEVLNALYCFDKEITKTK
jgi:hypothetical protein